MLDLDENMRARLLATGALTTDKDGEEVLVGLTVAESNFYLRFEHPPSNGEATEAKLFYLTIRDKHLSARVSRLKPIG